MLFHTSDFPDIPDSLIYLCKFVEIYTAEMHYYNTEMFKNKYCVDRLTRTYMFSLLSVSFILAQRFQQKGFCNGFSNERKSSLVPLYLMKTLSPRLLKSLHTS